MIRRLSLAMVLFVLCLTAAPAVVSASGFDPFGGVCNSKTNKGVSSSTICSNGLTTDPNTGKPINPVIVELAKITNIVAYAAGAAAIIVIIISAIRFITSGSDISAGSRLDTDVEDARRALVGAVIGLIIIVVARTLIIFVLSKL